MFLLKIFAFVHLALATASAGTTQQFQHDIDEAYRLIFKTATGRAICTHILGGDPDAFVFHLGVSKGAAMQIASQCVTTEPAPDWIYPTQPSDIRKLSVCPDNAVEREDTSAVAGQERAYNSCGPRKFVVLLTDGKDYRIESYTDLTNTTVLLTEKPTLSLLRLVQLLSHEMAVYFDSKATPTHIYAKKIPQLANLTLDPWNGFSPWIAISDPLTAHGLTYFRALRIERAVLQELANRGELDTPAEDQNPYVAKLLSDACDASCIVWEIMRVRALFEPLSLPLIAYSPIFRKGAYDELMRLHRDDWSKEQRLKAQEALLTTPRNFYTAQTQTDFSVASLQRLYPALGAESKAFETVRLFMREDLFNRHEMLSLQNARVAHGPALVEFMKQPLLSGYNILLSSGPRVRIRGSGQ